MDNPLNSEWYKELERDELKRKKTVKTGENVIHLDYLGEISDADIELFKEKLATQNIDLSYYNKSGAMYNCLDDIQLVSYIAISHPILLRILKDIYPNALWDAIKYVILLISKKLVKKTYTRLSKSQAIEKPIKFGLKLIEENRSLDFELDGNINEKLISNSLDQVLEYMKNSKQKESNDPFQSKMYFKYSVDKLIWEKVDIHEYISFKRSEK
jgi:hypothetical protein